MLNLFAICKCGQYNFSSNYKIKNEVKNKL